MENYLEALNPQRSAVVEACAGSGKTWMLVSRILRLLLDGVPPAEILAITFTRLAAREMEERLLEWLTFLAVQSDEAVLMFPIPANMLEANVFWSYGGLAKGPSC